MLHEEPDVWRAVELLSKRYGVLAGHVAMQRLKAFVAAGDNEGKKVWERIARALVDFERRELRSREHLQ